MSADKFKYSICFLLVNIIGLVIFIVKHKESGKPLESTIKDIVKGAKEIIEKLGEDYVGSIPLKYSDKSYGSKGICYKFYKGKGFYIKLSDFYKPLSIEIHFKKLGHSSKLVFIYDENHKDMKINDFDENSFNAFNALYQYASDKKIRNH